MIKKTHIIISIIAMLVAISAFNGTIAATSLAKIRGVRFYSGIGETRIVIDLKAMVQYKVLYSAEPGVSIRLVDTETGIIRKRTSINDELVNLVTLREEMPMEEIPEDVMDTIVEVSFKRRLPFTISALESPARIVIDVKLPGSASSAQTLNIPPESFREVGPEIPVKAATSELEGSKLLEEPPVDKVEELPISGFVSLRSANYELIQFCLNILLTIAVVIMGIKLWRVSRMSKKNSETLQKGQNFADMISRLQKEATQKDTTKADSNERNLETQSPPPAKLNTAGVIRKAKKPKERVDRSSAIQKKYEKVYKLAQLGLDRLTISQQSNIPIGEVNLILDLSKAKAQSANE